MAQSTPVIFFLHGDDEFALSQFVHEIENTHINPASAGMNCTRLDGQTFNVEELLSIAGAMPFLSERRLVILNRPTARLRDQETKKRFFSLLDQIPETTILLLVEQTTERERKDRKLEELEKWAVRAGERVQVRQFLLPKGAELVRRIQGQAAQAGGRMTSRAAEALAGLIGNDMRLAAQEIEKLLAFVKYQRPVEVDDVQALTADTLQGDIFQLVDALGNQQSRQAMAMLHRLLDQQDPLTIFSMVQRQFRMLLQAREILDIGGNEAQITRQLNLHPFVAGKVTSQARRFRLAEIENIYRQLLSLDEALKTGQIPAGLGLETFVAAFKNP